MITTTTILQPPIQVSKSADLAQLQRATLSVFSIVYHCHSPESGPAAVYRLENLSKL